MDYVTLILPFPTSTNLDAALPAGTIRWLWTVMDSREPRLR